MKRYLLLLFLLGVGLHGWAQERIASASSHWVKVKINPVTPSVTSSVMPFSFRETFANNARAWQEGTRGDFTYEISNGSYTIHRNRTESKRTAFSFINLPDNINLNKADTFTIQVDIIGKAGLIPEGGLLLGMLDSLNYCQVRLTDQRQVIVSMVLDGKPANRYFPGGISSPQRSVRLETNTLMVRRRGANLHVYINRQEISSSPFPYRYFVGNNIGLLTSGDGISFRNLTIRAKLPKRPQPNLISQKE